MRKYFREGDITDDRPPKNPRWKMEFDSREGVRLSYNLSYIDPKYGPAYHGFYGPRTIGLDGEPSVKDAELSRQDAYNELVKETVDYWIKRPDTPVIVLDSLPSIIDRAKNHTFDLAITDETTVAKDMRHSLADTIISIDSAMRAVARPIQIKQLKSRKK